MPKPKLTATTEMTVTTDVKMSLNARRMILQRCDESITLGKEIKERKGRKKRIEKEIDELFAKEKQGKALLSGTKLDDFSLKMVLGKTKKFDQVGFMKHHGLTQADFDEFTTYTDNEPYVSVKRSGAKEDDE